MEEYVRESYKIGFDLVALLSTTSFWCHIQEKINRKILYTYLESIEYKLALVLMGQQQQHPNLPGGTRMGYEDLSWLYYCKFTSVCDFLLF